MELPKFLIADNSELPENIFILHTEYPRFLLDVESEEIEWFDALEESDESDLDAEIVDLIDAAFDFFNREMGQYEEESDK